MKKIIVRVKAFCALIVCLAIILMTTVGFQWAIWTGLYPSSLFLVIIACPIALLTAIWVLIEFGKLIPDLFKVVITGKEIYYSADDDYHYPTC